MMNLASYIIAPSFTLFIFIVVSLCKCISSFVWHFMKNAPAVQFMHLKPIRSMNIFDLP